MQHLPIVFFILVLFTSLSGIAFLIILAWKNQDKEAKFLLLFQLIFLFKLILNNVGLYVWLNIPGGITNAVFLFFNFLMISAASLAVIFFMPVFFHYLLNVSGQRLRNRIVFGLFILTLTALLIPYLLIFIPGIPPNRLSGEPLLIFIYILLFFYLVVLSAASWKIILRKKLIPVVLFCLSSYGFFGMLDYQIVKHMINSQFYPSGLQWITLFHAFWNIWIIIYSLKKLSFSPSLSLHADGVSGFLIRKYGITGREKEIILALAEGKSNQEIGDAFFISRRTVKNHIYNIYKKLEIKNRVELINLLRKNTGLE